MIDPALKYRTRDGRPVVILRTDLDNALYPVVAVYRDKYGEEQPFQHSAEGRFTFHDPKPHPCDLVLADAPMAEPAPRCTLCGGDHERSRCSWPVIEQEAVCS